MTESYWAIGCRLFGDTLGSPVKKIKLFFFGGCHGRRTHTFPNNNLAFVPIQT
jgi:hypothetical protein